ncbi:MAG: HAMP domain-containing histidine kinase [Actinomycetota bacterium]|nr:HAMP domain-containing histidine kinase [Actinomycetota bacterium]
MLLKEALPSGYIERALDSVRGFLPRGNPLPPDVWTSRHRGFVIFLWVQAIGLVIFGVVREYGLLHSIAEGAIVAVAASLASLPNTGRVFRSVAATLGLMSASAILVHLSGGTIEAHFHFFVMVSLITLYQEWTPFLLSVGYVVLHHGIVGLIAPETVFNHPAAVQNPLKWALVHGAFILGASASGMLIWRRNEDLREREQVQTLANRSLSTFNSRVAHDLKNPLVSIQGAASVALTMLDSRDDLRLLLELIHRQADRGQSLVTSLLKLAQASGKPNPEPVSTRVFLDEIVADFPHLDVGIGEVPDTMFVDPIGLRQAISNLLVNAHRYASRGDSPPEVTIHGDEAPDGCRLIVRDDGPGIPDAETHTIFEPLVRGGGATGQGSGLGLSIVAAVAEAHGGRAWYEPAEGGGSEFWLYFPSPVSETPISRKNIESATA